MKGSPAAGCGIGTRDRAGIRLALEEWVTAASEKADTVIIACNTASVRLLEAQDIVEKAASRGIRVISMVDLLDRTLALVGRDLRGKTVALMGTEFTVGQPRVRAAPLLDSRCRDQQATCGQVLLSEEILARKARMETGCVPCQGLRLRRNHPGVPLQPDIGGIG